MNPRRCHRACSCLKENRAVLKHGQVAAETDVSSDVRVFLEVWWEKNICFDISSTAMLLNDEVAR